MTRHFRNSDYQITIYNPEHLEKGKLEVEIDGRKVPAEHTEQGYLLPDFRDGKKHMIQVTIRNPEEQRRN